MDITREELESEIHSVHYITAHEALIQAGAMVPEYEGRLRQTMVCYMLLRNGHMIVGSHCVADEESFDVDTGMMFAHEEALVKVRQAMTYARAQAAFAAAEPPAEEE